MGRTLVVGAVVAAGLLTKLVVATPFQNGSFEFGSNPPSTYRTLVTGDTSIAGWQIQGRIDWINRALNPGWAQDGSLGVQLVADSQPSVISQTFSTAGGSEVQVSFYTSAWPTVSTSPLYVDFINDGVTQTETVTFPTIETNFIYSRHVFTFPVAAGTTVSKLSFRNDLTYVGPVLDHVTLNLQAVDGFVISEGYHVQGDLSSLLSSDDERLCLFPDGDSQVGQVEFTGTTDKLDPSEVAFTLEYSVLRPGLSYSLDLYNDDFSRWTSFSGGIAATADTEVIVVATLNAGAYVSPSGGLRSRVTWQPINDEDPSQDGWLQCVDFGQWSVFL